MMMLAGNKAMVQYLTRQAENRQYTIDSVEYIQAKNIHKILISRTIDKSDEAKACATLQIDFPTIKGYRIFSLDEYANMTNLNKPMTDL